MMANDHPQRRLAVPIRRPQEGHLASRKAAFGDAKQGRRRVDDGGGESGPVNDEVAVVAEGVSKLVVRAENAAPEAVEGYVVVAGSRQRLDGSKPSDVVAGELELPTVGAMGEIPAEHDELRVEPRNDAHERVARLRMEVRSEVEIGGVNDVHPSFLRQLAKISLLPLEPACLQR